MLYLVLDLVLTGEFHNRTFHEFIRFRSRDLSYLAIFDIRSNCRRSEENETSRRGKFAIKRRENKEQRTKREKRGGRFAVELSAEYGPGFAIYFNLAFRRLTAAFQHSRKNGCREKCLNLGLKCAFGSHEAGTRNFEARPTFLIFASLIFPRFSTSPLFVYVPTRPQYSIFIKIDSILKGKLALKTWGREELDSIKRDFCLETRRFLSRSRLPLRRPTFLCTLRV